MRQLISHGLKRLARPDTRYARGDRHAKILAVATVKGGVGKTTTSVNLAAGLARFRAAKVLLIDLDAQGHCTTSLSAHVPGTPPKSPISAVLLSNQRAQVLDAVTSTSLDRLDLTTADPTLAEAEGRLGQKIGKELLLRDALSITRSHYDYIIIDCPPNQGNLTLNALLAANKVLIPTDLSPLAIQGADELLGTVVTVNDRLHHPLEVAGILLTRVDARNQTMNAALRREIHGAWGDLMLPTEISINAKLSQAQHAGSPIFDFAPTSRGARNYEALTSEIAGRM